MSKWAYCYNSNDTSLTRVTLTKNTYLFFFGPGFKGDNAVYEALSQAYIAGTCTAELLSVRVASLTGEVTLVDRKNGANGGQSLLITTTGIKTASGSTSLSLGDLYCGEVIMSSGHSDTAVIDAIRHVLDDGGANEVTYMGSTWASNLVPSTSLAASNTYTAPIGHSSVSSGSAGSHPVFRNGCTLSRLRIYVDNNSEASSCTFYSYINGATGNQSVSVGAGLTGSFVDTSNSDTVSAGNTVSVQCPAVSVALRISTVQYKAASATVKVSGQSYLSAGWSQASALSRYGSLMYNYASATESDAQNTIGVADVWKNLGVFTVSTLNAACSFKLRVNGANPGSGPSVTIPTSASGWYYDLSGSYTSSTTDLLCYLADTSGSSSGALNIYASAIQQGVGTTTTIKTIEGLAYANVKTIEGLAIANVKSLEGLE